MKRYVLTAFLALVCLALLALVGAGLLLTAIHPDEYKEKLSAAVRQATGKTLEFEGAIQLVLFPRIGLRTGKIHIDDEVFFGTAPLVSIGEATATIALQPLMQGTIELETVELHGVVLKLVTNSDGQHNWEAFAASAFALHPLLQPDAFPSGGDSNSAAGATHTAGHPGNVTPLYEQRPQEPIASGNMGITSVRCSDFSVRYINMQSGDSFWFKPEPFTIEPLEFDRDVPLNLAGPLYHDRASERLKVSLQSVLHAVSAGKLRAQISKLTLAASSKGLVTQLALQASLQYTPKESLFTLSDLRGNIDALTIQGNATVQNYPAGQAGAEPSKGLALTGSVELGEVDAKALGMAYSIVREALRPIETGASRTHGQERLLSSSDATGRGGYLDQPQGREATAGEALDDAARQPITVLTGTAKIISRPAPDQEYSVAGAVQEETGRVFWEKAAFWEALRTARVDVKAAVQRIAFSQGEARNIRIRCVAENGRIQVPAWSADVFAGKITGTASLDATLLPAPVQLTLQAESIHLEDALHMVNLPLEAKGRIEAQVDLSARLTPQGIFAKETLQQFLSTFDGKGTLQIASGSFSPFPILSQNLPKSLQSGVLTFDQASASWQMKEGVALVKDILLRSASAKGKGSAALDFIQQKITLGLDFPADGQSPAASVAVSGSFAAPVVTVK